MLTSSLPAFTDAQIGLVVRLYSADREELANIIRDGIVAASVIGLRNKGDMIAHILRHVDQERLQRSLCQHGAARYVWFGFDTPEVGVEDKQPGLFDKLEDSGPALFPGAGPYEEGY